MSISKINSASGPRNTCEEVAIEWLGIIREKDRAPDAVICIAFYSTENNPAGGDSTVIYESLHPHFPIELLPDRAKSRLEKSIFADYIENTRDLERG